jgi:hypothetical protein
MRAPLSTLVVISFAIALTPTDAQAQEVSRLVGTWVFNRSASTSRVGDRPQREVRTFEDQGDGMVRETIRGVDGRGNDLYWSYTARHDGSDYRVLRRRGRSGTTTISFTAVDAYTSTWLVKTDGTAFEGRGRRTVSKDGLTYTRILPNGGHPCV